MTDQKTEMQLAALALHASGRPGKIEIMPTKSLATQRDLSLAYSRRRATVPGDRKEPGHRL
jgi:malate dehydrogenase (oxaloacetate-decarboxylating)(NADP+)